MPKAVTSKPRVHPLETLEMQQRLLQLQQFRRQARLAHQDNRRQMAIDADYYDGIQLTLDQISVLEDREQPIQQWNVIKSVVNWIIGIERKSRVQYNIMPRHPQAVKEAKTKTKVFAFIEDETRSRYIRSEAFTDSAKVGVGWLDVGAYNNPQQPIYYRRVDWRDVWFDSLGKRSDRLDWRYLYEEKWTDLDIAIATFEDRKADLEALAQATNSRYPFAPDDSYIFDDATDGIDQINSMVAGGNFDGYRNRVRVTHMQYRMPGQVDVLRVNGNLYGALDQTAYRKGDELHDHLVKYGYASLDKAHRMVVRHALFSGGVYLRDFHTPYNHDQFTLVPIFCYRRDRDGMPYGLIRDMRSPQDDINAGKIRARFLMSAKQFLVEKTAIHGPVEIFRDEMQRADGIGTVADGRIGSVKELDHSAKIQEHLASAQDGERFIHNISGVTPELQGQSERDLSGVAVKALQNQGATSSGGLLFDNYYDAFGQAGDIELACIEQFMDQEKVIRITGEQNRPEFVTINTVDEQGNPVDSITASKADFKVSKMDYRETIRQAMMQSLGELITNLAKLGGKGGEVAISLLDLYVELYDDLPNKEEAVARIRKITGQEGVDEELTPEEKAAKQQALEQQQAEMQRLKNLQDQLQELELRLKAAEVANKEADVKTKEGKALESSVNAMMTKLDGFMKAMEVAGAVKIAPELVQGADTIIEEAEQIPIGGQGNGQA